MSLVSKDSIIQACADAYKEGTGSESVKAGELASGILEALSSVRLPSGWAMGQFNTTDDTMSGGFSIEHGLGAIPDVVIIFRENPALVGQSIRCVIRSNYGESLDEDLGAYFPELSIQRCFYDNSAGTGFTQNAGTYPYEDTQEFFVVPGVGTIAYYLPALTYRWIAVKLEA